MSEGLSIDYGGLIGGVLGWASQGVDRKAVKTANDLEEQRFNRLLVQADTAHEREVKDLKKAGLNPVLSASGGSGSQTGGSAGLGSAHVPNSASRVASSAQLANTIVSTAKLAQETKISEADAMVARDIAESNRSAAESNAQTAKNNAIVSGIDAEITSSPYGKALEYIKRTGNAVGSFVSPALDIVNSGRLGSARQGSDTFNPYEHIKKSDIDFSRAKKYKLKDLPKKD